MRTVLPCSLAHANISLHGSSKIPIRIPLTLFQMHSAQGAAFDLTNGNVIFWPIEGGGRVRGRGERE